MSSRHSGPAGSRNATMGNVISAAPNVQTALEIEVEGLSKAFGEHQVLSGVDLRVRRGDIVAIVGGSGTRGCVNR